MAYSTYTTEAIVCGVKDSYTSDRSYLLFTEAAGMLWASARSVREERSKQRFALQAFSMVRVSLVRGRSGWRIGSVESQRNYYQVADTRSERGAVVRMVKLLRRLLQGEEPQPALYALTVSALDAVSMNPTTAALVADHFCFNALHNLGYIPPHQEYQDLLVSDVTWSELSALPALADQAIERALEQSHL